MASTAKRIRLSDDDGSTYSTLPGNSAELRNEAGEIVDTIFGQNFQSSESGLIGWTVSSNALYKGFAGYVATLKQQGTSTAMTDEAMSQVGSTSTYEIDDAAKNIFDRGTALTVSDDGSAVAASNIKEINYLFGTVTFIDSYTVTGAVTISGNFFPTASMCGANSFTLTQNAEGIDNTDLCKAQTNGGYREFEYGLRQVALELSGIYSAANGNLAKLTSRETYIIELNPDGSNDSVARGYFRMGSQGQSGNVGALEEEGISFVLNVPDDETVATPFAWSHTSTSTINAAIKMAIDAWEAGTFLKVQYLPDGSTGIEGDTVITEISLSGGLEAMNEFSVNLQGTGATSTVS